MRKIKREYPNNYFEKNLRLLNTNHDPIQNYNEKVKKYIP